MSGAAARAPDPRLQLAGAGPRARRWLAALCIGLPLAFTLASLAFAAGSGGHLRLVGNSLALTVVLTLGGVAALTTLLWAVLARLMRRHALALDAAALDVRSSFYRTRVALSALDLAQARVVDLDEHTGLRPLLKTNGFSVPGFRSGWFRLRDGRKAFVAIADGRHRLWLPTRAGHGLLLEPRDPAALLARLRELATPATRG